jgi:hypothetical protein
MRPEEIIVGTWECDDPQHDCYWVCWLEFDNNGRFEDDVRDRGVYRFRDGTLYLDFDKYGEFTYQFTFDGNDRLILIDNDDGERISFFKHKKKSRWPRR